MLKTILIILSMTTIIACSQMSLRLDESEIQPFKEFSKVKKSVDTLGPISINVTDMRGDVPANQIGFGYTGVKYKKTPVLLKQNVNEFLKSELTTELTKRNILVQEDGKYQVEVLVTKLSVNEFIEKHLPERALCEIEFQLKSQHLTKTLNARYWSEVTSPGDLGDGTEKIAPTFASCINVITDKIVEDKKFRDFIQ